MPSELDTWDSEMIEYMLKRIKDPTGTTLPMDKESVQYRLDHDDS